MISTLKIAYNIGFASALTIKTHSAYIEMGKYEFNPDKARKLKRRFTRGYADGFRLWSKEFRELQEREVNLREKLLAPCTVN